MTNDICGQLARSGLLLPDVAAAILAGNIPPLEEIVLALVIGALDAHAVVAGDPRSSTAECRIARLVLAAAFLSALATLAEA